MSYFNILQETFVPLRGESLQFFISALTIQQDGSYLLFVFRDLTCRKELGEHFQLRFGEIETAQSQNENI